MRSLRLLEENERKVKKSKGREGKVLRVFSSVTSKPSINTMSKPIFQKSKRITKDYKEDPMKRVPWRLYPNYE
jgi:hypothetical protein